MIILSKLNFKILNHLFSSSLLLKKNNLFDFSLKVKKKKRRELEAKFYFLDVSNAETKAFLFRFGHIYLDRTNTLKNNTNLNDNF